MNRLHENNLLRIIYDDKQSSFDELLEKDSSVSVHERNIQILATEMYKVRKGISTPLIKLFEQRNEHTYNLRHSTEFLQPFVNFVHCGNERILQLGPRIWGMVPDTYENMDNLYNFKNVIKKWKTENCPCRICKDFVKTRWFCKIA